MPRRGRSRSRKPKSTTQKSAVVAAEQAVELAKEVVRPKKRSHRGHGRSHARRSGYINSMAYHPAVQYTYTALGPADEVQGASPGPPTGEGKRVCNVSLPLTFRWTPKAVRSIDRIDRLENRTLLIMPSLATPVWYLEHNESTNFDYVGWTPISTITAPDEDTFRQECESLRIWNVDIKITQEAPELTVAGTLHSARVELAPTLGAGVNADEDQEFTLPAMACAGMDKVANYDGAQDVLTTAMNTMPGYNYRHVKFGAWGKLNATKRAGFTNSVATPIASTRTGRHTPAEEIVFTALDSSGNIKDRDVPPHMDCMILQASDLVKGTNTIEPTFRVMLTYRAELEPTPGGVASFLTVAQPEESAAVLKLTEDIYRGMPATIPVAENDFGGFLKGLVKTVSGLIGKVAPIAGPLLSAIPGVGPAAMPIAQGVGALANGINGMID